MRTVNRRDPEVVSSLFTACLEDDLDAVRILTRRHRVDVNVSIGRKTPLIIACQNGNFDLADLLIRAGANVMKDKSALCLAVKSSCDLHTKHALIELLLKSGADIDFWSFRVMSPINYAILNRCVETVQLLILKGASINQHEDGAALPPLSAACIYGDQIMIQTLLEAGAKPFWGKHRRGNALISVLQGHGSIKKRTRFMRLLIERGAHVNKQTFDVASPLHFSCHEPCAPSFVHCLLQEGAHVNAADEDDHGRTALHVCCDDELDGRLEEEPPGGDAEKEEEGAVGGEEADVEEESVEMEVEEAEDADEHPHHPLSCMSLLLQFGADVDLCDHNGDMPLHVAMQGDNTAAMNLLLDHTKSFMPKYE